MRVQGLIVCLVLNLILLFAVLVPQADAVIVISEILADPPAGAAGDANGDGVTSSNDDEFI